MIAAEAVVAPIADRLDPARSAPDVEGSGAPGDVRLWRCANERAQAQAVAAASSGSCARASRPSASACSCAPCATRARQLAVALEERALPYRLAGAAAFFGAAEVRDVLAWLRLLVDPGDAGAVVRALARPPIELRAIDLARCTQIARRRKLDMVSGAGRGDRVAADPARGARARPRLPQAPPPGRRARWTRRAPTCSCTG